MTAKRISLNNLPDTIKAEIKSVENPEQVEQLSLFVDTLTAELKSGNKLSNTFNRYDMLNRFVRNSSGRRIKLSEAPKSVVLQRAVSERSRGLGVEGGLEISPAIIKDKDGDMLAYPSDREEKVERALIRLASQGKIIRLSGKMGDRYAVHFTINELINELKAVKQSLNNTQVKQALEVLKGSELKISCEVINSDGDTEYIESRMNYLSAIHFSSTGGKSSTKCVAVLNELMAQQIESFEYKGYYYDRTQSFKRSLTIWLAMRLYSMFRYASLNKTHHFKLSEMMLKFGSIDKIEDAAGNLVTLRRDMTKTMQELQKADFISQYKVENYKDDEGKIVDYKYTISPSEKFCNEVLVLNKHDKRMSIESQKVLGLEELAN